MPYEITPERITDLLVSQFDTATRLLRGFMASIDTQIYANKVKASYDKFFTQLNAFNAHIKAMTPAMQTEATQVAKQQCDLLDETIDAYNTALNLAALYDFYKLQPIRELSH